MKQIRESYILGHTPYRLHEISEETYVCPVRVYEDIVVATTLGSKPLAITKRNIKEDNSKLIYWKRNRLLQGVCLCDKKGLCHQMWMW